MGDNRFEIMVCSRIETKPRSLTKRFITAFGFEKLLKRHTEEPNHQQMSDWMKSLSVFSYNAGKPTLLIFELHS